MKKILFLLLPAILFYTAAKAQLISGDAFLKGNYAEVGINKCGSWGSIGSAPTGYHGRSGLSTGYAGTSTSLGFVADPAKDGWTVGTPDKYNGDYFLPASPYDGWGISINGTVYSNDRTNSTATLCRDQNNGSTSMTGSILSVDTVNGSMRATWSGSGSGIQVKKIIQLDSDKLYFTVRVILINTTSSAISNIYYGEYVDPDNDAYYQDVNSNNLDTKNSIVYQNPTNNQALVTALGQTTQAYLGLGSKDCRAKVIRGSSSAVQPSTLSPANWYAGTGSNLLTGTDATYYNAYIGIAFSIATIAANDSTSFVYTYILRATDYDEALAQTSPGFSTTDSSFVNNSTIHPCAGSIVNLHIINGDFYNWTWSPATHLNTATGTSVFDTVGSTPVTYIATGSNGSCTTLYDTITVAPTAVVTPSVSIATTSSTTICAGTSVTFTATPVNGGTAPIYQWVKNGANITGATNATYTTTGLANNDTISVKLTSSIFCVTQTSVSSNKIIMTVNPILTPSVSIVASSSAVCAGTSVTFTATPANGGSSPTYQWQKNGINVGTNSNTYTDAALNNNDVIKVVLTSSAQCLSVPTATSNSITMTIYPIPVITNATGTNPAVCGGTGSITLTVTPVTGNYTVSYTKNGNAVTSTLTASAGNIIISSLLAGTYNNFSITSANSCMSAAYTNPVILTDPASPATPSVTGTSPVCSGNTISLTSSSVTSGVTYSWSGPNSFTSTTQNPSITNAQTAASGTYSVTATANGCTSVAGTVSVVVNPTPHITTVTSTNPTACLGNQGTITINGLANNTSYTVNYLSGSATQATTLTSNGSGQVIINSLSAGAYSGFTVTASGCTSAAYGTTVTLTDPNPPNISASNNGPICSGNTLNLTASSTTTGVTYSWSGPNGFTSAQQNPSVANAAVANSGNYTVTATLNNCSASATTSALINATPAMPTAGSNSPVCSGTAINLTGSSATTGVTYSWSGPNSFTSTMQNPSITNAQTAASGTYSVTAMANGCTSVAGTVSVVVNPTPHITTVTSTNPTACLGTQGTITINGLANNTSYTVNYLSGSATQTTTLTSNGSGQVIINSLSAGAYSGFTVTASGCTSAAYSTTVTLTDPNPPNISASNNGPICSGNTLNLTASSTTTGVTYSWSGPNGFTSAQQNPSVANAAVANSGNYTVTATLNNCSASATTSALINITPAMPTAGSNSPVCSGTAINLTGSSATNGVTYNWSGPNGFTSTTQNPSIANAPVSASGTYSVTATANGCTSIAGTVSVVVNPTPHITTVTSTNPTACLGTNGSVIINGLANNTTYTINYLANTTAQSTILTANGSGQATIGNLPSGSYSSFTASVLGCSSATYSGTITLTDPNPPANVTATNSGPVCSGGILNLSATSTTSGVAYSWSGPDGFTSAQQNPTLNNVPTAYNGSYTVTATLNNCSASASTIAEVDSTPAMPFVNSNTPICSGTTLNLTGNSATNGVTYNWSGPNGFTSAMQNPSISNAIIADAGIYTATASLNGCSSSANTIVTIDSTPNITNVIANNPTTCQGADGSIVLSGLVTGITYNGNFTLNGIIQSFTASADNNGQVTITALSAGSFTNISVGTACTSNIIAGPITLTDPNPPAVPAITGNTTICSGNILSLNSSSATNGVIYSWSGPDNFTSAQQNISVANATVAASGTYTVTATLNNCQSSSAAIVTVDSTPIVNAGNITPICSGNAINLSATSSLSGSAYSWAGPNGFISALQNPSINNAITAASGTYSVTATNNNCPSLPATVNIIVDSTPAITAGVVTNPTTCGGSDGSIQLSDLVNNTSYTIHYTKNGIAQTTTATADVNGHVIISGLNAAGYSGIYVVTGTCTSNTLSGPYQLTDPAAPAVPVITAPASVCAGTTLSMNGTTTTTGVTYSWSGPDGFTSSTQGATVNNVNANYSGTYTLTVTKNNCTSSANTNILVKPLPQVNSIGNNGPICSGSTLDLNADATAGATYSWTGPDNFTSNQANPFIDNASVANSGTYSLMVTLNGCNATGAGTTSVTVKPIPDAPFTSAVTYCQYSNAAALTAIADAGGTLRWYTSQTGGTGSLVAPSVSTQIAGTTNYYVSQNVNGCESPRAILTVHVTSQPPAPNVTGADASYCQFEAAVPLPTGDSLLWYSTGTGNDGGSAATPVVSTQQPGTYNYFVAQIVNGCESPRADITIIVKQKPDTPHVTPATYCQNSMANQLTAAGQNLLWYSNNVGGTGNISAPTPVTNIVDTVNYFVSQTVNGCESDRSDLPVITYYQPAAIINASKSVFCQHDTATFSYNGPQVETIAWNMPAGASLIFGDTLGSNKIGAQFDSAGTYNLILTLTTGNGQCTSTQSYNVNVKTAPSAAIDLQSDACIDQQVRIALVNSSAEVDSFVWNFYGANIISGAPNSAGPYMVNWNTNGAHYVSLTVLSNKECPSIKVNDSINIHSLPDAKLNMVSINNICSGDTVALQAASYDAGNTYQWLPAQYFTSGPGIGYATAIVNQSAYLSLLVTDPFGCTASDSVLITTQPCCNVSFPNAFTPNNDTKNDIFRPITLGNHRVSVFRIVNRWGQTVFSTGNEKTGWDGTFNGVPQEMGTYQYYIRYDCDGKTIEQKGEVMLVR